MKNNLSSNFYENIGKIICNRYSLSDNAYAIIYDIKANRWGTLEYHYWFPCHSAKQGSTEIHAVHDNEDLLVGDEMLDEELVKFALNSTMPEWRTKRWYPISSGSENR